MSIKKSLKQIVLLRKIVIQIRVFYFFISTLLSGSQHYLHNFLYYKFFTVKRDNDFKKNGLLTLKLMDESVWKRFSESV